MLHFRPTGDPLSQLKDVLHSPIILLKPDNQRVIQQEVSQLLSVSGRCCIITNTSTKKNKFEKLRALYKSLAELKDLQRQIFDKDPLIKSSLIGIYPSLEYPACVYELDTNADRYVSDKVLPHAGLSLPGTIKLLIHKFLGINPAVGALGLALYRK